MEFSNRLQTIREHYGLSTQEVARALGMTRQGYRQMLLRDGRPSWSAICNLLQAYPINANYLLLGEGQIERQSADARVGALEGRITAIENHLNITK